MTLYFCLFAKAPTPGNVKTRLAVQIGEEAAAQLARAFLDDSLHALLQMDWGTTVVAQAGRFESLPVGCKAWDQPDGDLGARIEHILRRALLDEGASAVLALGADTPGLPLHLIEQAADALVSHDAVLGPCADGGFYLLGLKQCPRGLLGRLPWSQTDTFEATLARLAENGLSVHQLPTWFDVDRPQDLVQLQKLLQLGEISARRTQDVLAALGCDVSGTLSSDCSSS